MLDTSALFTSASDQLAHVRRLNTGRGWGFTEEDFAKLGPAPDAPTGKQDRLTAVVLEVVLPGSDGTADIGKTVDELWTLAAAAQEKSWRWKELRSDPEHLALFEGVEAMPGLRWRIVDLAPNWDKEKGIVPTTVRGPNSPHVAILMAAVLHPAWVRAMDGESVPFVWLPGLKVNVPGYDEWSCVPDLYFSQGGRRVDFDAHCGGRRRSYCAVPVFRE